MQFRVKEQTGTYSCDNGYEATNAVMFGESLGFQAEQSG